GLGANRGTLPFHVPMDGGVEASQEGSFNIAAVTSSAAEERIGSKYPLKTIEVPVEAFDNLNLCPDAVKIDVQGFEREVLAGMRRTLTDCPPLAIYVENGPDERHISSYLRSFGYSPWHWNGSALSRWKGASCENLIYRR